MFDEIIIVIQTISMLINDAYSELLLFVLINIRFKNRKCTLSLSLSLYNL